MNDESTLRPDGTMEGMRRLEIAKAGPEPEEEEVSALRQAVDLALSGEIPHEAIDIVAEKIRAQGGGE